MARVGGGKGAVVLAPMQAEVVARVEYCAALLHHLAVSLWGSHMICMALLQRCVALFWRLLRAIGPDTFLGYNKCVKTVERYDAAVRTVKDNTALLERCRPELEAKRVELERITAAVEAAAEDTAAQGDVTAAAEAAASDQRRVSTRLREEIRGIYATVEPAVVSAMRAVRGLKQAGLDDIRILPSPPHMMKLALAGLCVMLGEAPEDDPSLSVVDA